MSDNHGLRLMSRILRGTPGYACRAVYECVPPDHPIAKLGWRALFFVTDAMRAVAVRADDDGAALQAAGPIKLVAGMGQPSFCAVWPTTEPAARVTIPGHQRRVLRAVSRLAQEIERVTDDRVEVGFGEGGELLLYSPPNAQPSARLYLHEASSQGSPIGPRYSVRLLTQMLAGEALTLEIRQPSGESPGQGVATILPVGAPDWLGMLMPRVRRDSSEGSR